MDNYLPWPYAAKAIIQHEWVSTHLNIWLTFRHQMRRSSNPLAEPPVYDIMPPLDLWLIKADGVDVAVVASEWVDQFTLLLTSNTVASAPARVTLEYNGPNQNLEIIWRKQWEPWGPILSLDITT
jgi:hypothetical protein